MTYSPMTESIFKARMLTSLIIHPHRFSNQLIADAYNVIAEAKGFSTIDSKKVNEFRKANADVVITINNVD